MKRKQLCQLVCIVILVALGGTALAWTTPVLLTELNNTSTGKNAISPHLSDDGLTMYFSRKNAGNTAQIIEAYRDSTSGPFTTEKICDELGTLSVSSPWVSSDGLRMYHTRLDGSSIVYRLRMAFRESTSDDWTRSLGTIPGTIFFDIHIDGTNDAEVSLSADELTMFYRTNRATGDDTYELWMATRDSITDVSGDYVEFSNPIEITELNDGLTNWDPFVLPDGLTMYFSSKRDGRSSLDLYKATRGSLAESFSDITRLDIGSDSVAEVGVYVTPDESSLYFYDVSGIWYSVPEPATILLFGLGGIILRRKR